MGQVGHESVFEAVEGQVTAVLHASSTCEICNVFVGCAIGDVGVILNKFLCSTDVSS